MESLLYHTHHSLHLEDIPFWLSIAEGGGDRILELGCGTGRVCLPLARAGWDVCGLDINPDMLAVLKQQLTPEIQSRINLIQADFRNFFLATRFSAIIMPCNTLSTLPASDLRRTLTNINQHLLPKGLFAASLPNPERLMHLPEIGEPEIEEIFPHPLDGGPVQVSSCWKREQETVTITWYYDHLGPNGDIHRTSAQAKHQLLPVMVYEKMLHEADFTEVLTYGDFDLTPFNSDSPELIIAAA